jgi:hypothetical protein
VLDCIPTYTFILVIVYEHDGNVLIECKDYNSDLPYIGGEHSGSRTAGNQVGSHVNIEEKDSFKSQI